MAGHIRRVVKVLLWMVATVLLLLLGCAAVVVPLAARAVRRSTIARLRMEPLA